MTPHEPSPMTNSPSAALPAHEGNKGAIAFFGVALLIAAVISTASYLPTRRAVALEPGDALRYE